MKTFQEFMEIAEGMTMKDFKANRRKLKRKEASDDAKKRGHVGKEWYNSGRTYSPDEAKSGRANMPDHERSTRKRSAIDPEAEDDNYSADKTKNPKKLRKQKAMGELGEEFVEEGIGMTMANALGNPPALSKRMKLKQALIINKIKSDAKKNKEKKYSGKAIRSEDFVNEAGDWWHPDPKKDRGTSGVGNKMRAREDRGEDTSVQKKPDYSRRLKPGESYMDFAKRKRKGG